MRRWGHALPTTPAAEPVVLQETAPLVDAPDHEIARGIELSCDAFAEALADAFAKCMSAALLDAAARATERR